MICEKIQTFSFSQPIYPYPSTPHNPLLSPLPHHLLVSLYSPFPSMCITTMFAKLINPFKIPPKIRGFSDIHFYKLEIRGFWISVFFHIRNPRISDIRFFPNPKSADLRKSVFTYLEIRGSGYPKFGQFVLRISGFPRISGTPLVDRKVISVYGIALYLIFFV